MRLLYKIFNRLNVFRWINANWIIEINGRNLLIPTLNKTGHTLLLHKDEQWMTQVLTKLLNIRTGGFIDIGANIGQTLLKLKSVSWEVPYVGFEPNPVCVSYMYELIKVNRMRNCLILPIALSNETRMMDLRKDNDNSSDLSASIVEGFRNHDRLKSSSMVPVFSSSLLKNYLVENNSIIKIDAEGSELEVLEGCENLLAVYKPIIICEILPVYKKSNHFRFERQVKIESIFSSLQYACYRIKNGNEIIKLSSIGVHSNLEICNYIFAHESIESVLAKYFVINPTWQIT